MSTTQTATQDVPAPVALTELDRGILGAVEESLARGLELQRWWSERHGVYRQSFPLERTANPDSRGLCFFDSASLSFGVTPVVGVVQKETFIRSPLRPSAAQAQMRSFALKYFLRLAQRRQPPDFYLSDVRQSGVASQKAGFGYSQHYYKLRGSGRMGKFPLELKRHIVDLRQIGDIYEWIVLHAILFDLSFDLSPFGQNGPHLNVPMAKFTEEYLIVSPELVVNEENPEPGVLGRYGVGYAFLHDPTPSHGPLLWGPGRFIAGFESIVFEVRDSGETVVTSPFTVNRPQRLLGISPDPVVMGIKLADALSGGLPPGSCLPACSTASIPC